jgi:hypothetical protein
MAAIRMAALPAVRRSTSLPATTNHFLEMRGVSPAEARLQQVPSGMTDAERKRF